jgi:large subunit ribosomal protein L30
MAAAKKLKVTQIRSLSNRPHDHRLTIQGLGLHGIRHSVVVDNTPSFRGMIKKVIHLVTVEEVSNG